MIAHTYNKAATKKDATLKFTVKIPYNTFNILTIFVLYKMK